MSKDFFDTWHELEEKHAGADNPFSDAEEVTKVVFALTKRRIELGYSQRDLAEKTGLKQSAIARLESLGSVPRLDTVVRIARALSLNIMLSSVTKPISELDFSYDEDKSMYSVQEDIQSFNYGKEMKYEIAG